MNMKKVRILCMLLMLIMAAGTFAACKQHPDNPTGTNGTEGSREPVNPGAQTEQERYLPQKEDLDGYVYRMVLDGDGNDNFRSSYCGITDDGDESVLDHAFITRNSFLESYFNIEIEVSTLGSTPDQMNDTLRSCQLGNEDFADVVFCVAHHGMRTAIPEGLVLNLNNINGFNLDASYWDQNIQKEYSINNMLFTLEGDYTTYEELTTFVVFFNDFLYDKYGYRETYGSPYDMVKEGKWTLEALMEMTVGASTEEENITQKQWGMFTEQPVPYLLYVGTGNHAITHKEDGSLQLLFDDSTVFNTTYNILEDLIKKFAVENQNDILVIDKIANDGSTGIGWNTFFQMFSNDQVLFQTSTLGTAKYFSDMKNLFGILPMPKYTSTQEDYFSCCSAWSHLPLMIPATALNHAETTAKIAEAMCYYSKYPYSQKANTVVDAEYNWLMINKICRTYDDREMLEIVFANKTYDLDYALYISGVPAIVVNHVAAGTLDRLSADFRGEQNSALSKLIEFVENTKNNVRN